MSTWEKSMKDKMESEENLRRIIFDIVCKVSFRTSDKLPVEGQRKLYVLITKLFFCIFFASLCKTKCFLLAFRELVVIYCKLGKLFSECYFTVITMYSNDSHKRERKKKQTDLMS